METFAQELIDAIIDHLPRPDMHSCSLVAKRWRRRCQQHTFAHVVICRERHVELWHTNILQDPNGIPSYVQHVEFLRIGWRKLALLSLMLKCFCKLKSLTMVDTVIPLEPEGLDGSAQFGKFGQQITRLALCTIDGATTTMMSLILSLPNLQGLSLNDVDVEGEVSIPPGRSQNRRLQFLELHDVTTNVIGALARYPFASRQISMGALGESLSVTLLLAPSSQTLVSLELKGMYFVVNFPVEVMLIGFLDLWFYGRAARYPAIYIPQLPALKTLIVETYTNDLSHGLTDILFSIRSVPQLSSVTFTFARLFSGDFPVYDAWRGVDGWLEQLARTEVREKDGLKVEMRVLSEEWPAGDGFLCSFEKAGGEVRVVKVLA